MDVKRVVAAWVFSTAIVIVFSSDARAENTSPTLMEGMRLYQAGQFAEAIPYFDKVLTRHPNDISTLNKRGICYLRTDQPSKALADFDRVRQRNGVLPLGFADRFADSLSGVVPTVPEAWGNRGIALLMLGKDREALESFLTATRQWSSFLNNGRSRDVKRSRAGAYQGAGQAYHLLGDDESAFDAYTKAIETDPSDPNGYCGRGDLLASQRLFDRAIEDYQRALELDPSHSRSVAGMGVVHYDQGLDNSAIADFDRAIAIDPRYTKAYRFRGALYARKGQNDLAIADYTTLISLSPRDAGALKDRGGVLVRVNQFEQAIKDLNMAIEIDPKRASAYQNRGAAYNGLGQYERAIEDLTQAIRLTPTSAGAHANRGLAHYAIGQYDQSVVDLSEAIKLDPHSAIFRINRADVFARLGLRDRAAVDLEQANRLDGRLVASYLKTHQLNLEDRQALTPEQEMALRLDSKDVSSHYETANKHRENREWSLALHEYDRVIATRPDQADAYVARGWSRLCAGVDGAASDARAYRNLKGWSDPFTPYMSILEALSETSPATQPARRRMLDEAISHNVAYSWPTPMLRYLRGDLNERALLSTAIGHRQQAEAHAFLGIDRLQKGDKPSAILHLRTAADINAAGSIATDVSRAVLERLESRSE
jgi:tetratricopeptide (TPR) repeat protein